MKKLTWYHQLGFYNNPFSIKPAVFHNELMGQEKLIKQINEKLSQNQSVMLSGQYGTGKTTIVKGVINRFGGKREVIYYNYNQSEKLIDYDKLLIGASGFFRRLFKIRKKNMIILLDEVQEMNESDMDNLVKYREQGFFRGVVLVGNDIELTPELESLIGNNKFEVGEIDTEKAVKIIRKRIGDIGIISDKMLAKIFNKDKNPRAYLKNCEDLCRRAYENGDEEVSEKHIKEILA